MSSALIQALHTLNEFLTAGIAITAFSLLLYALSFNLRDRVARSFALIMLCVMTVYIGDALTGVSSSPQALTFWLYLQWPGIIFLPAAYLHFSDAILATTGRPSRGRRRFAVRLVYIIALAFLLAMPWLVGALVQSPVPYLQRTPLTYLFAAYYTIVMVIAWVNFYRAYQRSVTSTSRRRMSYLALGALAPALGVFPYLLFGAPLAAALPLLFWLVVVASNILISVLLVLMAYAVAFFGVAWPDRVIKRRLFKWLMRGPVVASTALMVTTLVKRAGVVYGVDVGALAPAAMVACVLIFEHLITLAAPIWERWLFYGRDRADVELLQSIEERLLTSGDLRQYLESILAAVCDRLQTTQAFVAVLGAQGVEMVVNTGGESPLEKEELSVDVLESVSHNGHDELFTLSSNGGDFWLLPLSEREKTIPDAGQAFANQESDPGAPANPPDETYPARMLGLLGVLHQPGQVLDNEQWEALAAISERAALALRDRDRQQQVFSSLEALSPQVERIQRLRAAARYDSPSVLDAPTVTLEEGELTQLVRDALTHYWGGPRLTESPLLELQVVQQSVQSSDESPANALRAILRKAIDQTRPEGERRFTTDWMVYNILEMKFMEGRKVRDIAKRLAMSEADLYRKQRVAIESVAKTIIDMEAQARTGTAADRPGNGFNGRRWDP